MSAPDGSKRSAPAATHKVGDYRGPSRPQDAERERLGHLAATLDPGTGRRMRALGIARGWRCLEIGAAEGSMARWMAGEVGEEGRVVAGDIDLRFLSELDLPNIEVRELDVRSGALEEGSFDLAYCRTLLLHLPDPDAALSKLLRSLRPGGWLLAEDSDMCVPLPARLRALGLEEQGFEANASFQSGGSPGAELQRRNLGINLGPMLVEHEVVGRDELERVLALYADGSFGSVSGLNVAAWGRRPGG